MSIKFTFEKLYSKIYPLIAGVSPLLCQVRFIALCVFSAFAILWNSLVGIVLLSVCRTNTMGSQFLKNLYSRTPSIHG